MNYDTSFNSLDLLVMATCTFSIVIGFFRGFFKEIMGILAYTCALFVAKTNPEFSKKILMKWINNPSILNIVNQFLSFFVYLLIFLLFAQALSNLLRKMVSENSDRIMGALLGFVRGLVIVAFVYIGSLFFMTPSTQPAVVLSSKSHFWMESAAEKIIPLMPESLKKPSTFQESLKQMGLCKQEYDVQNQEESS